MGGAVHAREDGGDFVAGHDHGDVDLLVGAHGIDLSRQGMVEDALVEEHQGIHRLVLGGGCHLCVQGQVGQEGFDLRFGREEVLARPHAMEPDEADDALHRGAFGVHGIVMEAEHLSHFIEECGWLTSCRVGPIRSPS